MIERKPRTSLSQKYQSLYCERSVPVDFLESFAESDGMYKRLNPWSYNDEIAQLEEQLKKEFWRIVDTLTPRQREVIRLYADGYTQMEIAKALGINQSSVHKNFEGNVSYGINEKTSYGGSKRKLQKIVEQDEKIIAILKRIAALREEDY